MAINLTSTALQDYFFTTLGNSNNSDLNSTGLSGTYLNYTV
jgi:hypothetical protein